MSASGDLFGIGPNADAPFWVRIQVVAVTTPVPSLTPTSLPTTTVLVTGKISLKMGQGVDLDSGRLSLLADADGMLDQPAVGQLNWKPLNDSRFAVFGLTKPGELECRLAAVSAAPIMITELESGVYLCYRTGDGLPGLMQVETMPTGESPLVINFTTWETP